MFDDAEQLGPHLNPLPEYRERRRRMHRVAAVIAIFAALVLAGSCQESSRPRATKTSSAEPTTRKSFTSVPTTQTAGRFGIYKYAPAPETSWASTSEANARSDSCLLCHG